MSKTSRGVLFALLTFLIGAAGGIQARGETADAFDAPICYEAVFVNDSPTAVRLTRLESALPNGGAYVGLAAGSQVSSEAQESGGRLIWEGPFSLPPDGELSLRYWLAPTESATQLPSLEIVAFAAEGVLVHTVAQPGCPMSAAVLVPEEAAYPEDVTVEKAVETPVLEPGDEPTVAYVVTSANTAFIPLLLRNYQAFVPSPGLSFEETFDTGVPPEWTPFVNYPGLSQALWFWKGGVGWGRYDFDPYALGSNYKYWGLSMYKAEQAEASTDYRIEATIRTGRHTKNPLTGIWFRGKHQLRTDLQGGDVTGYYLVLKEKDDTVRLGKIRAADRRFDAVDWVQWSTYAPGIENFIWYDVVIEVEGSHIRCWVEGVPMIDWSDPAPWTEGTVGLVAYQGAGFDYISVSALDN